MKKAINREHLEGRVYDHSLSLKVTGENSKHPGTEYIRGSLDVATDDDILNIVTVNFTYVTATTSKGNSNETFSVLKRIIDSGKTVIADGAENATLVKIDTALGLNDFYTNKNGKEELVSAKRNDGGFVSIVSRVDPVETKRNKFECDMLINGTRLVEADEERNIPSDYLVVKGAVFNFRNAILPVEFIVRSSGGIAYFESLEASPSNMIFTKVWGEIKSQTIVSKREEESAFGKAAVREYERKVREWVIIGAAKEPYEMGDEQTGITTEEIKQMLSDREVYLADIKRRAEEWQSQKASTFSNIGATASVGSFNF